jgi:hypothetical protein
MDKTYIEYGYTVNYGLMRGVNFWLEGGLGYADLEKTQRYSIDSEGYLLETFPNQDKTDIYGYAMIHHYWNIAKHWKIGSNLRGEYSTSDYFTGLSVGLSLLWKH